MTTLLGETVEREVHSFRDFVFTETIGVLLITTIMGTVIQNLLISFKNLALDAALKDRDGQLYFSSSANNIVAYPVGASVTSKPTSHGADVVPSSVNPWFMVQKADVLVTLSMNLCEIVLGLLFSYLIYVIFIKQGGMLPFKRAVSAPSSSIVHQ
jgi:hypothetical protein